MKLSGLLWRFSFLPHREVKVPEEPERWVRTVWTFRWTCLMSMKSSANGPRSAHSASSPSSCPGVAEGVGVGVAEGGAWVGVRLGWVGLRRESDSLAGSSSDACVGAASGDSGVSGEGASAGSAGEAWLTAAPAGGRSCAAGSWAAGRSCGCLRCWS